MIALAPDLRYILHVVWSLARFSACACGSMPYFTKAPARTQDVTEIRRESNHAGAQQCSHVWDSAAPRQKHRPHGSAALATNIGHDRFRQANRAMA